MLPARPFPRNTNMETLGGKTRDNFNNLRQIQKSNHCLFLEVGSSDFINIP